MKATGEVMANRAYTGRVIIKGRSILESNIHHLDLLGADNYSDEIIEKRIESWG